MPEIDDPRVQPALEALLTGDAAGLSNMLATDPGLARERWGENTLLEWTTQPPHGVSDEVVDVVIAHSPALDRALNLAGCWNLPDLCRRLLAAGADPSARADADITPLESAAMHSSTEAADVLAQHGLHRPTLWLAAATGSTDLVGEWVDADGQLTRPAGDHRPDWAAVGRPGAPAAASDEQTLLGEAFVFAALNGRLDTAALLLERGASVDARPYANTTALHFAIQFRRLPAVGFLLDRGASRTICDDNHGGDALGWAEACHDDTDPVTDQILALLR